MIRQRARRLAILVSGHWQLFAITLVVFVFWGSQLVLPLKILIVFLHELSHALAIILTGGSVESLTVSPQQGGMVVGRGGSRFISLSAGYLGSLAFGLGLLLAALKTRWDKALLGVFGGVMVAVAVLYVRQPFAVAFCAGNRCGHAGHGPVPGSCDLRYGSADHRFDQHDLCTLRHL